ncbi:MAPEG family protein [Idiomarina xiamenensis]|uniref:Microsomal glutathione S-transferase 1 n=1 Tax=Idiomarina xiamenensis 10-D-4 TaxID=740709 RepID=K2KMA7_9GAMM|nr:MAPEG family protein [Idiomarina xiamenensis]EKE87657.1 hypothetical protein A10D4_01145 [Idiomarina xiamenensis 10-D-4]
MNLAMAYYGTLFWMAVIILTVLVQAMIAGRAKAMQSDAIPGQPPREMSHHNFVFRAWRTHQNSLENLSPMLGSIVLAILVAAPPFWVMILTAVMAVSRIIHMLLYYQIATEKNPSPRSYFFLIAYLANVALVILSLVTLLA